MSSEANIMRAETGPGHEKYSPANNTPITIPAKTSRYTINEIKVSKPPRNVILLLLD